MEREEEKHDLGRVLHWRAFTGVGCRMLFLKEQEDEWNTKEKDNTLKYQGVMCVSQRKNWGQETFSLYILVRVRLCLQYFTDKRERERKMNRPYFLFVILFNSSLSCLITHWFKRWNRRPREKENWSIVYAKGIHRHDPLNNTSVWQEHGRKRVRERGGSRQRCGNSRKSRKPGDKCGRWDERKRWWWKWAEVQ